LFFREIKILTALTVIINNIYSVEFLEYMVSKIKPSTIINHLSIIEFLYLLMLYIQYLCARALKCDVRAHKSYVRA